MLRENDKVLVVKPSSLGDIVHSLAFLNTVKENYPEVKIHWVVGKAFEDLLNEHPLIEKVFPIDKDRWKNIKKISQIFKDFFDIGKQLRQENYQMTIDLQGLLRSGIITALSGAPVRWGFKEARELSSLFYNRVVSAKINQHAVWRYLKMAEALGCVVSSVKFPLPKEKEPEWLKSFDNYAVIIPSARWQSKNWPIPYFVELIKSLPNNFVIVGSKSDEEIASNIEKYSQGKAISLAGKTSLRELIAVFKKSIFVISPDTGSMHLAVACGKRVVAIFGPTSPERTGPFGDEHLVINTDLPCSPCFKKYCPELKCMKEITPKKVYDKIKEWGLYEISKWKGRESICN